MGAINLPHCPSRSGEAFASTATACGRYSHAMSELGWRRCDMTFNFCTNSKRPADGQGQLRCMQETRVEVRPMLIRKTPQQPVEAGEDAKVGFRRPLTQVLTSQAQSDVSSESKPASQTQFLPWRRCLGKQRTRARKAALQEFHRLATHGGLGPSTHPSKSTVLTQECGKMTS